MRMLPLLLVASLPFAAAAQTTLPEVQKAPSAMPEAGISAEMLGMPAEPDAAKTAVLEAGKAADALLSDFDSDKVAGNEPAAADLALRSKAPSTLPEPAPAAADLGTGPEGDKVATLEVSHAEGRETLYDADKIDGTPEVTAPLMPRDKAPGTVPDGVAEADFGQPAAPVDPKVADVAVSHAAGAPTIYDDDKIAGNEPAPMPFDEGFDSGPLSERQKYPSELAEGTDPADFGQPAIDAPKTELAVSKAELGQPNIEDNDKIAGNPYVEPPLLPRDKAPSVLPDPVADADMGQPAVEAPKVELAVSKAELDQPNVEDYDKIAGNPVVAPPLTERSKAPAYEVPFGLADEELGLPLAPEAAKTDMEISKAAEAVETTYDEDKIAGNEYMDPEHVDPVDPGYPDSSVDEYGNYIYDVPPPAEMVAAIRTLLDDPAARTATLDGVAARGLAPENVAASFQSFVAALYDVPEVRDRLANEIAIVAFDVGLTPETPAVVGRMAAEYMATFGDADAAEGISRLPAEERRGYLADTLRVAETLPPDQCGPFLDGTMAAEPMRQVLLNALGTWTTAEVETAMIRQAAAAVAAVQDNPPFVEMLPADYDRAQELMGTSAFAAIDATENPNALLSAYGDPFNASPADLCTVHKIILRAALDTPGADGDLIIRYLADYGWTN
ncbi:MAG: hypothetical protein ACRC6I_02540 [Paracoccaceae bacterium]